jgi:predicted nucleic acid-binding protein
MKYVLDSSVALKWVVSEADSARAVRLRDEYRNGNHTLIAPDLFTPEIANALVAAERQSRIKGGEAALFVRDVQLNAPAFVPTAPLLVRGMEIALATRHAVYDCVYVALAERESCELVTADDKLARALRPTFPFIVELKNLP